MKTTLYYFTGTGNSLWAARELARHIPETRLVPMAKWIREGDHTPAPEGRVGFVFPVSIGGLPLPVAECAETINLDAAEEIFALVTMESCGDGAWRHLNRILKKRSYRMNAAYSVKMPTNHLLSGDVLPEDREIAVISAARSDLDRIAEKITRGDNSFEKGPLLMNIPNRILHPLLKNRLCSQGARFQADETCNGCGTCELVCPTYNIIVSGMNRPEWGNACASCFACINYCPRHAIQSGTKTATRGRYHHPDVSITDMMIQNGRE